MGEGMAGPIIMNDSFTIWLLSIDWEYGNWPATRLGTKRGEQDSISCQYGKGVSASVCVAIALSFVASCSALYHLNSADDSRFSDGDLLTMLATILNLLYQTLRWPIRTSCLRQCIETIQRWHFFW